MRIASKNAPKSVELLAHTGYAGGGNAIEEPLAVLGNGSNPLVGGGSHQMDVINAVSLCDIGDFVLFLIRKIWDDYAVNAMLLAQAEKAFFAKSKDGMNIHH